MPAKTAKKPLILASNSPQRRDLLTEGGIAFEVRSSPVCEPTHLPAGLSPAARAAAVAYFKARATAQATPERTVLAADTVVAVGEDVLGKPADADEARAMLRRLSRVAHRVITGVALIGPDGRRCIESEMTRVTMRAMSDEQVARYVASGAWRGKAGGYAVQEADDAFVTRIEGSYSNVVGLPIERVQRMLAATGEGCDA
ncbi:MAG: septum formation protein Maf [Phycisphaerae bacterium]|nr:septum formation protein Maf [Phycisphaerae bacterium]